MFSSFPRLSLAIVFGCAPLVLTFPAAAAEPAGMAGMDIGADAHHEHGSVHHFRFGAPGHAGKATRTIAIGIGDMTFDTTEIAVHPGETVRFVLTNTSTIDHEFTLGDAATQRDHRQEMAEALRRGEVMEHDDPNMVTVKPGKTRELTWRFASAGKLEFDCNIPGHYESGMKGTIIVR
jgi:uncharacterized cupredoxin-like copper-binding protein